MRFKLAVFRKREAEVSESNEGQGGHLPVCRLKDLKATKGKAVSNWEADGAFISVDESKRMKEVFREWFVWQQASKVIPSDPHLLVFKPLFGPLPY